MISIEMLKYKIIEQITSFDNESILKELESFLEEHRIQTSKEGIIKPLKKDLSIDEMIKDQKYNGVNLAFFDELINKMDIQEPIDELIAMT